MSAEYMSTNDDYLFLKSHQSAF